MGNLSYQINKITPSTYCLIVRKKRMILGDEVFTEKFHIPFLDLLFSLKEKKIQNLFLEFVVKNVGFQTINEKKDELTSFFYLFSLYLNHLSLSPQKDIGDWSVKFDKIIKLTKSEYISKRLSKDRNYDLGINFQMSFTLIFEMEYDNIFRIYLKHLGEKYKEYNIDIPMLNPYITELEDSIKEYIIDKKKSTLNVIVEDCEVIIKELYNQFSSVKLKFYENCLIKGKEQLIEKQYWDIQNVEIGQKHLPIINEILSKNPDLSSPNIIKQSGKQLINYLLDHENKNWIFRLGCQYKYNNRNVFIVGSFQEYLLTFTIEPEIKYDPNNKKFSLYTQNGELSSYGGWYDNFLDVNLPQVKKIHLNVDRNNKFHSDVIFELKNLNSEKSINKYTRYVPVINEDKIPCLLDLTLFKKYNINDKLIFQKKEIVEEIIQKLDFLKSVSEEIIQQEIVQTSILNSSSRFTKDVNKTNELNEKILKNFHFLKSQSYFFHQLFHRYQKDIFIISGTHQFVIPDSKTQENEELGRRTEWIVDRFFKNFIEFDKWFYTIEEEDQEKRVTNYPNYPFRTIPICKTIWNNQSVESYKPYDFSINFRNIEYKIEVKSTRGGEENVFYISVKELEEMLKDPDRYFILRLSYIQKYEMYYGIQFNDEFYGRFYKIKPETIKFVKKNLPEWKEYYKTNTIRFTVDQFELIPDLYDGNNEPDLLPEPNVLDYRYWKKFEDFVQKIYFDELERILDSYSVFPEVSKLNEKLKKLKTDVKFHSVGIIGDEEDLTFKEVGLLYEEEIQLPNEDDLPF